MYVARPTLQGVEDGGVHQLDDGRNVPLIRRQPVNRKIFLRVLVVADDVKREAFGDAFKYALRLLGFLQQIRDLRISGYLDPKLPG